MDPLTPGDVNSGSADPASHGALRGEFGPGRPGCRASASGTAALALCFLFGSAAFVLAFLLLREEIRPGPPGEPPKRTYLEAVLALAGAGTVLIGVCASVVWALLRPSRERLAVYDKGLLYTLRGKSEMISWDTVRSVEERSIREGPPGPDEGEAAGAARRKILSFCVHRPGGDVVLDGRFAEFERLGELLRGLARERGIPWQQTDVLDGLIK